MCVCLFFVVLPLFCSAISPGEKNRSTGSNRSDSLGGGHGGGGEGGGERGGVGGGSPLRAKAPRTSGSSISGEDRSKAGVRVEGCFFVFLIDTVLRVYSTHKHACSACAKFLAKTPRINSTDLSGEDPSKAGLRVEDSFSLYVLITTSFYSKKLQQRCSRYQVPVILKPQYGEGVRVGTIKLLIGYFRVA